MKNLLSLGLIIGSNMALGAGVGLGGVLLTLDDASKGNPAMGYLSLILIPLGGAGLGFINGLKFEVVSAITDYFKPEDNTAIKVGVNLGIDVISGYFALNDDNRVLGTLLVMDAINFGIESYMDNQDCIEFS